MLKALCLEKNVVGFSKITYGMNICSQKIDRKLLKK